MCQFDKDTHSPFDWINLKIPHELNVIMFSMYILHHMY